PSSGRRRRRLRTATGARRCRSCIAVRTSTARRSRPRTGCRKQRRRREALPRERGGTEGRPGVVQRLTYRLALVTAATTLVLIVFGGLVTNTGAALAVPDWPTTFGQSMFLY